MGGILERFPRLKLCFAHGGGSYPQIGRSFAYFQFKSSYFLAGRIAHGFKVCLFLSSKNCVFMKKWTLSVF